MVITKKTISPELKVKEVGENFQTVLNQEGLEEGLKNRLLQANTLLLPNHGYQERKDLVYFPSGTSDLLQYLKDNQGQDLSVDICSCDDKYQELSLHADWLILAHIIVKLAVIPLLIDLLANFLSNSLGKRLSITNMKAKLTVVDDKNKKQVELSYNGPAAEFHKIFREAISRDNKEGDVSIVIKAKRRRHK
jgi:hypothetical protein